MTALRVVDLVTTKTDKKYEPAGCMASTIIETMRRQGDCLPHDLMGNGYTSEEIAAHFHMAHALASVEARLMNAKCPPEDLRKVLYA